MKFYQPPVQFENIRKYSLLYIIECIGNGYELNTVEVTNSKRIKDEFTDAKEFQFVYKEVELTFRVDTSWNLFNYINPPIFLTIFADKDMAIKQIQKYLTELKGGNNLKMIITN